MKQLSGQDAMFLHSELEGFPTHIAFAAVYDQSARPGGPVRFKDILALLESRLDRSPIFRQKLTQAPLNLDQPYWVDDDRFDLEFHVRHIALPKPGDWRQLCIQLARLHARSLDRNRPLWETYVIEGLDNVDGVAKGSFCIYTKIHHCAVDGASSAQFLGALTDLSPEVEPPQKAKPWSPKPSPKNIELLTKAYINTVKKPLQLARFMGAILPSRLRINSGIRKGLFLAPPKPPSVRFNQSISPHRVVGGVDFDFSEVKKIKSAVDGATINDAILAIVSGALRQYLEAKKELPAEQLVAGCPVNIRAEGNQDSDGNFLGLMTVGLSTDDHEPLSRLTKIVTASASGKAHTQAMGAQVALEFADSIPAFAQPMLMQMAASTGFSEKNPMQNTTVSNVPGATEQLYVCGAKMVKSLSLGVLSPGMGLFHGVGTAVLDGKFSVMMGFLACREMLPDPQFYTECLQQSFEELLAASSESSGTRKLKRGGTKANSVNRKGKNKKQSEAIN